MEFILTIYMDDETTKSHVIYELDMSNVIEYINDFYDLRGVKSVHIVKMKEGR